VLQAAVVLSPAWIELGEPLPSRCALHGEPATANRKLRILTPAPSWIFVLLLVGVLPFLLANHFLRKRVEAASWPFCARCGRERLVRLGKGLGLFAAGVALFVIAGQVGGGGTETLIGATAFLALIFGAFVAQRGLWRHVAGTVLTNDQKRVVVQPAHPAFAAEVPQEASVAIPTPPGAVRG
jgi:hypothetical protein